MCARITARVLILALVLANARAADSGATPQAAPDTVRLEVFREARLIRGPQILPYPVKNEGREGWVVLNMMIDPKGHPYEITVLDSTGDAALEKAAISATRNEMLFQPAKHGSTPVESSLTFKLLFYSGEPGLRASRNFIAAFQNLVKDIDAAEKERAATELAGLAAENLYEEAYKSYVKFLYDHKWGTELEQLTDLRHTIAADIRETYLPRDLFVRTLIAQLSLEVKRKDYGSALDTWKTVERLAPKSTRDQLQPTIDQIIALRNRDEVVTTPGQLDRGASWNTRLFKRHFSIAVVSGTVSEIKLRCQRRYVFFKYDPEIQYNVNPSAGECYIEVLGDPGTTFNLVQS